MRTIKSLAELDEILAELEAAALVSDDELRRLFSTFRMDFDTKVPVDPYSGEYREHQFSLYRHIAGKNYSVKNESSQFNVLDAARSPFPYYTASCDTVGNHLIAIGHAIRTMELQPGAKILEFGPGWGNTTLALAMMGFDITAIDIEPNFCQLIESRAAQAGIRVNVVNGDFSWIESVTEPVDAILFFECFHHCSDHLRLIAALDGATKDGGKVYFAAEPISTEFPIPWGLRLDGESLWAIRRNGWLELGFNESYFIEMMMKHGWSIAKHSTPSTPWGTVHVASKCRPLMIELAASDPSIRVQAGERRMDGRVASRGEAGYLIFGPYLKVSGGQYRLVLQGTSIRATIGAPAVVEVVQNGGADIIATRQITVESGASDDPSVLCELDFELVRGSGDLEVRVLVSGDTDLSIAGYRIEPRN